MVPTAEVSTRMMMDEDKLERGFINYLEREHAGLLTVKTIQITTPTLFST